MRLRHIEVFHAVMQTGSISAASRLLHVTQPALTQVLQHAESTLGFRLFERSKGRLMPTAEARVLFDGAQKTVDAVEDIRILAANLRDRRRDHLRIAGTDAIALKTLPLGVMDVQHRHVDVTSDVRVYHRREIIRELLAQDIDLGFSFDPPVHPGVVATPVGEARFVAAIPAASEHARSGEPMTLQELAALPLVMLYNGAPPGLLLRHACQAQGLTLTGPIQAHTSFIAVSLVAQGAGIALVDSLTAASLPQPAVVFRAVRPVVKIQVCALQARYHEPSHLIEEIQAAVQRRCAEIQRALPE